MIENKNLRRKLRLLFSVIYTLARWVYRAGRSIFKPVFSLHPRSHNFAVAIRDAVMELLRPPEIDSEVPPEADPEAPSETDGGHRAESVPLPGPERIIPEPDAKPRLPDWLIREWRDIHEIEPQLFPEKWLAEDIFFYEVPTSHIARPYLELCELYGKDVSHVFLVPWLVKGGADLVAINYIRSLANQGLAGEIVVMATCDTDSPWKERLPESTRFIEFGRRYAHLSDEEQEKLLTRVLLQMMPRVIHNVNSELGYKMFVRYGNALADASKLYVSLFCMDMTPEGRSVGYAIMYLSECFDNLSGIFTDNLAYLRKLQETYGFEDRKMAVHYQPAPPVPDLPEKEMSDLKGAKKTHFDILWAGRLDRQKRADILISVAEKCRKLPFRFHVYGSSVLDADICTPAFEAAENITYYGSFNGLPSLPVHQYDVLLYTSQWDGLPNVLLEAISLGLPVVASDVGGISELIRHGETGFLIAPYDNPDLYADCLQKLSDNPPLRAAVARDARKMLVSRHSWDAFHEKVRHIPDYGVPQI